MNGSHTFTEIFWIITKDPLAQPKEDKQQT
jgi:hypothetical protein